MYCCTLQDVFTPEPPRLRRHLSAVVNLASTSDTLYCCTLQDVFKPEPPRLRRHLSAVVNLAKFREEKLAAFQVAASDVLPGGCF